MNNLNYSGNCSRYTALVFFLVLTAFCQSVLAQNSLPPKSSGTQYKKIHRPYVVDISEGTYNPPDNSEGDFEDLYIKAAGYAVNGDLANALIAAKNAVDAGLPVQRLYAGPREWFSAFLNDADVRAWIPEVELIHGPMLGTVTAEGANVWFRTFHEVPVKVQLSEQEDLSDSVETDAVTTDANKDYTGVITVTGLKPWTLYYYRLVVDGTPDERIFSFKTSWVKGQRRNFVMGFGGGSGWTPQNYETSGPTNNERMWSLLATKKFAAFLLIGDFVYHDANENLFLQSYCYYRRHSQPEFRVFQGGTPLYGVWDDHDFANNDFKFSVSPSLEDNPWKLENWKLFRNQWANPYYGGGDSTQGVYYDFHINGVDFFMLDGRYDRFHGSNTMLGTVQKQWLKDKLKASEGVFKVIVSDVPVSEGAKPGSDDTWDGFPEERTEIFEFIETNRIDGIFFVASDRHRSDHWVIARPRTGNAQDENYDFQEFMSSRLTNVHRHGTISGAEFGYNTLQSYGVLDFDMESEDPSVTYSIRSIEDEEVYSVTVLHSEMMRNPGPIGPAVSIGKKSVQQRDVPVKKLWLTLIGDDGAVRTLAFDDPRKRLDVPHELTISFHDVKGKLLKSFKLKNKASRLVELRLGKGSKRILSGSIARLTYKGAEQVRSLKP